MLEAALVSQPRIWHNAGIACKHAADHAQQNVFYRFALMHTPFQTTQPLPLSIQLYSLRSTLGDDRFTETLRRLSQIGFEAVEFAGQYGNLEPAALADFLQSIGLRASGLHAMPGGLAQLTDPESITFRYARALNCEFVSLSQTPTPDTLEATIRTLVRAQRAAADQGLTLTYHNHDREFERLPDGRTMLDAMREATAESNLQFQFDVFFAFHCGIDPCESLEHFRGRAPQIHFNDLDPEGKNAAEAASGCMKLSTELGSGIMDLPAIYRKAVETGVRLIVLEQHSTRLDPLESAAVNFTRYQALSR